MLAVMNYPAASSGVSKTTTGKTLRPKGRGIHPDGNKSIPNMAIVASYNFGACTYKCSDLFIKTDCRLPFESK